MVPGPAENGINESLEIEIVSVVESPDSPRSKIVPAPAELLF